MRKSVLIKKPLATFGHHHVDNIIVEDGIIEAINGDENRQFDEVLDASELVVLPGLINTHHHFYQTMTRACPPALDKELFDWLKALYPIWSNLSDEMVYVSSQLATAELILSGCTTASDHHYVFPNEAKSAVDAQVEAIKKTGIRAVLTRGSMSLSEEDGGLPPKKVVQTEDEILADSERVIGKYHQKGKGAMVQIALAPCSPFSVTESLMSESASLAREHKVRLHTHLAETADEEEFCKARFGVRPLDYLARVGWMNDDVWLAHGIHFSEEEIVELGKAGVGISHCPTSNMHLASGICRCHELQRNGAPVGIGVDGSASNDGSNMIQEIRQAMLLQRLRYGSKAVSHKDAITWATKGSARCLGRDDIGEIAVGKQADLAFFKLDELRFSGAGDPLAALIYCGAHKAHHVMVAGDWRVFDETLLGIDLGKLMSEHKELSKKMQGAHFKW